MKGKRKLNILEKSVDSVLYINSVKETLIPSAEYYYYRRKLKL